MDTAVSQTKRFARYEIIRKLGRSMTDVYLAFDPRMARRVILKLIEESRDDFTQLVIEAEQRGAQIQADLHRKDPRILQIYECGSMQGHFFVAMEFFEGKNLHEILLLERRLEAKRAARYAAEVCSQLDQLHSFTSGVEGRQRAVVHGDIKPSNIQVGRNDELRLLDFGIAKVITSTRNLTRHNLGSPTYCSPERLAKGQVDAQADLWALGVSLYELVSGTPPYQAQDTRKLENLIQSKRAPRSLPSDCPPALAAIIMKALAADIGRRYASAAAFERDLRSFLNDKAPLALSETRPSWDSNTTLQKAEPEPTAATFQAPSSQPTRLKVAYETLTRRVQRKGNIDWLRVSSIALGVLAVFLLAYLVGRLRDELWPVQGPVNYAKASTAQINADWDKFQKLQERNRFLGHLSPARLRAKILKTSLVSSADELIDMYSRSSDPSLSSVDWRKAQLCLRHAATLDPDDRTVAGELALCDGFVNLLQSGKVPGASRSEQSFRQAAADLPKSAIPHLGLARLYTYSYNNVGKALAELHQAEGLGYHLGPREQEEQGDGYLLRAESELRLARKNHDDRDDYDRLAKDDLDRARKLYEPISGFSNVNANLTRLDQDQLRMEELSQEQDPSEEEVVKPKGRPTRHHASPSVFEKFFSHLKWQ